MKRLLLAFTEVLVILASIDNVCAATPDPEDRRVVLSSWQEARQLSAQGHPQDAERVLRLASIRAGTNAQTAGTALRLGAVLTASGDTLEAGQQLDAATALIDSLSVADRAELWSARGGLAARNGDFAIAEQHFNAASSTARLAGSETEAARGELNALRARLDRKELAGLESKLSSVHSSVLRLPHGDVSATLLLADGELRRRAVNEFASATSSRRYAFESFDRGRDYAQSDTVKAQALGVMGALYEDEGRWDEAMRLTSQAVFLSQAGDDSEGLYRWDWQAARIQRQQGQLAQSTASMDRAMNGLADIRSDVMKSSRQAFGTLIEPLYIDYADINLRRAAGMSQDSAEEQQVLRNVRNQLESLKQAEVQDYFANQCAAAEASSADTAFKVAGTAVIYPILLPDRVEVLVETDGALRRFASPISRGEATFTARQLRVGLERTGAGNAYLAPAKALYRWLIGPADPWLTSKGVNTLVFVPSGALRTIPLGALHDGQRFLIEKYAVATTPAVSLVISPHAAPVERVLLAGLTKSVQGFAGLPGVADEMRMVSAIVPTQSMQDETFQLSTVRSQLSTTNFSVAHLATHGEFNSDYRRSFILTYDDRLTMAGLRTALEDRAIPLDLLVLSACQTAAGDDRAALGLAGVAIQAGVKSALATLWNISDTATAALMNRFYENSKLAGATKARSLQNAQIALLKSPEFAHPSYWAPYLLIGNWL